MAIDDALLPKSRPNDTLPSFFCHAAQGVGCYADAAPNSIVGSLQRGPIMSRAIIALILTLAAVEAAQAQTLADIDRREAALIEAWKATPLTVRKAFFVAEHPHGFGEYVERSGNVFKPGEKLVTYAEPVGYGWKDIGNGLYEFGFKVDFVIKSPNGDVLGGHEDFADLTQQSHARNREFMTVLTLNISDAPPGDYIVEYKLHDVSSDKTANFNLPFKIAQ